MWENKGAESIGPPAAHPAQECPMSHVSVQEVKAGVPVEHLQIYHLEAELLKLPQVDMPVDHNFCNGLYARTMHIPAGTVLTGAIHREESFFLVRKGELIVSTDNGPRTLVPGDMSISKIGTKRAGIALTDVEVTTFHANPSNEQEPQKLWDLFTIPAPSTVLETVQPAQLEESK
jgi:quercetin dioxygenase-like cupin family protein